MDQLYQNIGHLLLMVILLAGSAFFSATETAFFNLSARQINSLKKSKHRLNNLAAKLLDKPAQLLGCLLFGNMFVNVLFYALASILTMNIEKQFGVIAAVLTATSLFLLLILLGEILPKSIAYANSRFISTASAVPALICLKLFAPLYFLFNFLFVQPATRLLIGPAKTKPITSDEFKLLIGKVRIRGLITESQNKLLSEIIDLGFLKVRDCLQPRVDMIACPVTNPADTLIETMQKKHLTKIPVYIKHIDNIVGQIRLRQLLLNPDTPPDKLVQEIQFVPEQKSVESLLEFFQKTATDTAIAVDEYGGIAGLIRLEDIAEELLGPFELSGDIKPIQRIGPLEYRMVGNLSIHDWAASFNIDPTQIRSATIAGLVTALLGKIPKAGDVAHIKNLKFTVERTKKHRVETVILTLEPIGKK